MVKCTMKPTQFPAPGGEENSEYQRRQERLRRAEAAYAAILLKSDPGDVSALQRAVLERDAARQSVELIKARLASRRV